MRACVCHFFVVTLQRNIETTIVMAEQNENVDLGLRKFIKDLGLMAGGATLLATAPWLSSCTPDKISELGKEKARIGMIGVGSRGQYHIHNLLFQL